jgi:phosphoribosylglycinamide formyltransferase-1
MGSSASESRLSRIAVLASGPRTLQQFSGRIVNTHPAPLPRFGGKGMYGEHVHRAVLSSGVSASAATVHLVEEDTTPAGSWPNDRFPWLPATTCPAFAIGSSKPNASC